MINKNSADFHHCNEHTLTVCDHVLTLDGSTYNPQSVDTLRFLKTLLNSLTNILQPKSLFQRSCLTDWSDAKGKSPDL